MIGVLSWALLYNRLWEQDGGKLNEIKRMEYIWVKLRFISEILEISHTSLLAWAVAKSLTINLVLTDFSRQMKKSLDQIVLLVFMLTLDY